MAEAIDKGLGIHGGELLGLVAELGESLDELGLGEGTFPAFCGRAAQEFPADVFELTFHRRVVGEVHLLELVDEADQPVEGLLVNPGFRGADAVKHLLAQGGGLLAQ